MLYDSFMKTKQKINSPSFYEMLKFFLKKACYNKVKRLLNKAMKTALENERFFATPGSVSLETPHHSQPQ